MINKQNLWFLTLFSLILVLSIFYLTVGENSLVTEKEPENNQSIINITSEEGEVLSALRVQSDEERIEEMAMLQETLLSEDTSVEDKNEAYDSLKEITVNRGKEEKIETLIKDKFQLESFAKIKGDQINIVIVGKTHNSELANNIIRLVQEQYENQMYITIKFN